MTANDILDQIDDAFVSYLNKSDIGDIPPENVFPGHWKEGDDTKSPNIVVEASEAAENGAVNSGNWNAQVSVTVTSQADDSTRDAHKARVNAVFALILASDAEALVSAALDTFTLFAVREPRQAKRRNGRKWENSLTFEIECCGGDIS
jgi:hypothetical protein